MGKLQHVKHNESPSEVDKRPTVGIVGKLKHFALSDLDNLIIPLGFDI